MYRHCRSPWILVPGLKFILMANGTVLMPGTISVESAASLDFETECISVKNAFPRARQRSRQLRSPAARARLFPDRQIPASRHISRSDSRRMEAASSVGLSVKGASFKRSARCARRRATGRNGWWYDLHHYQMPGLLPGRLTAITVF